MNITLTAARRRVLAGAAAIAIAGGLIAASAPMASSAGGDNAGAPVAGMSAGPDTHKKDVWAVINADGSIARGKGVVSVTHSAGAGSYIVFFNKNVESCVLQRHDRSVRLERHVRPRLHHRGRRGCWQHRRLRHD